MKQSEIIKLLSDKDLKRSLILSQSLFLALSLIGSILLFENITDWFSFFQIELKEIIVYGLLPGILIVLIDLILMYVLPKKYYDDGGINVRIFTSLIYSDIFFICYLFVIYDMR